MMLNFMSIIPVNPTDILPSYGKCRLRTWGTEAAITPPLLVGSMVSTFYLAVCLMGYYRLILS